MEAQRLSKRAFAKASALTWGIAVLFVGLVNLSNPAYGKTFLEMMGSLYFQPSAAPSMGSVMILTVIALVDGAAGGVFFAAVYNCTLRFCKNKK